MEPDSNFNPSGPNRGRPDDQRRYNFRDNPCEDYDTSAANDLKRRRSSSSPGGNPVRVMYQQSQFNEVSPTGIQGTNIMAQQHSRFKPLALLPFQDKIPHNMPPLEAIVCQNTELFQSSADEGPQSAQLGLRCVNCARAMQRHVDSCIIFPSSIETMEKSLQLMIERHFPNCVVMPSDARKAFDAAHKQRREKKDNGRFSMSEFLYDICNRANVVNRQPSQTGIVPANLMHEQASFMQDEPPRIAHLPTQYSASRSIMRMSNQYSNSPQSQQSPQQYTQGQIHQSSNYSSPFVQTAHNIWECRYCLNLPIGHRGERYAWYAHSPPDHIFMEDHLRICNGRIRQQQQRQRQSYPQMQQQSFSSSSSQYHPLQSSTRPFQQQDQMQQSPFRPVQGAPNYSMGSFNQQQYRSQQSSSMTHPYQSSYQQSQFQPSQSWRPPLAPTGFSSSNTSQGMLSSPTTGKPDTISVSRDSNVYKRTDSSRPPRARPESSLTITKEDLKEAVQYLEKAELKAEENEDSLVDKADKYLITDYFYHVMKQLRICHFKEGDRTTRGGKRDNIQIGYGGLECIHCCNTPSARKFFWSNVDRLSNSFSEIPGHLLKCKVCPDATKKALRELKKHHPSQMTEKSRGSQKTFLRRVWRRMHDDISEGSEGEEGSEKQSQEIFQADSIVTLGSDSPDTADKIKALQEATGGGEAKIKEAAKVLADSVKTSGKKTTCILLAIDQDKEWGLSDLDCFVRQNLELFCATDGDAEANAQSEGKGDGIVSGQVGIRCVNCSSSKRLPCQDKQGYVTYPASLDDLFSAVRAYKSKHLPTCPNIPEEGREKFNFLTGSSSSSFGSIVRQYYLKSAEALGLRDVPNGGIRATGKGGFKKKDKG